MTATALDATPNRRSLLRSLSWYGNRIAAMSLPEIGHRIGEQVKRQVSRRAQSAPTARTLVELGILPGLDLALSRAEDDLELRAGWRVAADRLVSGRARLLGLEWPARAGATNWHLDPVTGLSWPDERFCFDIPYRRHAHLGDVKYVWELNRLQHLQLPAALAAAEQDVDLARLCAAEIDSWIDANPPYRGVNWASGIELALRVVSLLTVTSLLGDRGLLEIDRRRLVDTLTAHGHWLRRFPSRFSSANNHCVAEAGALFLLGELLPDLPRAKDWRTFGRSVLLAEAQRQLLPDGVGAEQSPTYTAFTLEWLLLCGVVAARRGEPFPRPFWERVATAGEHLRWITDSAGAQPRIGDDDEGRVLASDPTESSYVSAILGCLAAALDRADLAPPAPATGLRQAFFGRPMVGPGPSDGIRHFAAGGYTVARSSESGRRCLLLFDHGPLGFLSIAAHGHADALALWLHLDGQPVFVDAGTYLYHGGGEWRDHFRSTPAHNTLSIAGTSSSRIGGAFNWRSKARTTVLSQDLDAERWHVEAEHDGFVRQFGIRHRRRVERTGAGCFEITDVLRGTGGPFEVDIGFLLHPDLTVALDGCRATIRRENDALMTIDSDGPLVGAVQRGQTEPARAWYSSAFSNKLPTSRLAFGGRMVVDSAMRCTLRVLSPAVSW